MRVGVMSVCGWMNKWGGMACKNILLFCVEKALFFWYIHKRFFLVYKSAFSLLKKRFFSGIHKRFFSCKFVHLLVARGDGQHPARDAPVVVGVVYVYV